MPLDGVYSRNIWKFLGNSRGIGLLGRLCVQASDHLDATLRFFSDHSSPRVTLRTPKLGEPTGPHLIPPPGRSSTMLAPWYLNGKWTQVFEPPSSEYLYSRIRHWPAQPSRSGDILKQASLLKNYWRCLIIDIIWGPS